MKYKNHYFFQITHVIDVINHSHKNIFMHTQAIKLEEKNANANTHVLIITIQPLLCVCFYFLAILFDCK